MLLYRICRWRTMPWRRLWTKFKVNWTHHWMRKNRNVKFWTLLPDNSATICILWVHFITNLLQCSILNEKRRYCRWFYSLQCYRKLIISLLLLHDFFLGKRTTFYFMCNLRIPTTDLMFLFMTKKEKTSSKQPNYLPIKVGMNMKKIKNCTSTTIFSFLVNLILFPNIIIIMSTSISVSFQ